VNEGVGARMLMLDDERTDGVSDLRIFFGRNVSFCDNKDDRLLSVSGSEVRRMRAGMLSRRVEIWACS
jgi:hypothetical protein